MTDTLLRSLRERMLDESEPLAGLLRKCLLVGAETGSRRRDRARKELNGYASEADAKDAVQETMHKADRRWETIDNPEASARVTASRAYTAGVGTLHTIPVDDIAEHTRTARAAESSRRHGRCRGQGRTQPRWPKLLRMAQVN